MTGHNDLQPANTVYADGVPYAFIDWDLAGPAPPLDDLALAAITFTPLHNADRFRLPGCPTGAERVGRLPVFVEAYGMDDVLALLDTIEAMQRQDLQEMLEYGAQGIEPFRTFLANGEDRDVRWDLEWLLANRPALEQALRPA